MSWAVATVHPNTESRVARDIADLGFEVFNPRERVLAIRRGRRVYRERPMFPRYLMIKMCAEIFEVLRVRYLIDLIRTASNNPAVVLDKEIISIKSRCTGADVLITRPTGRFLQGELVTPKSGPLADLIGSFESSSRNRESAIFSSMGHSVVVSFKRGDLIAA